MSHTIYELMLMIPVFLLSIVLHEVAHAFSAKLGGDTTATSLNRLSLNPIEHIDPYGTIVIPIIAYISNLPLIGYAKPVPVDPRQFRKPYWDVIVSLSGPFMNFTLAVVAAALLKVQRVFFPGHVEPLEQLYLYFTTINLILGLFNLIPIPPLDGSHVLRYLLIKYQPSAMRYFLILESVGFIVLTLLIFLRPTRYLFSVIYRELLKLIFALFNL